MIIIDGSEGEGGGQMVRSSLALSMLTETPIRIENVRAGRPKPGLKRQHLAAIRAAAAISSAEVAGDQLNSLTLEFSPQAIQSGNHQIAVGSAGSTTLILQTVLSPLMVADGPSRLTLEGGTHNPWAPCFEFISHCFLPLMRRLGVDVEGHLVRHGFHPAGGGKLEFEIRPGPLKPFSLTERGQWLGGTCEARVANLPLHIAEREAAKIKQLSQWKAKRCRAVEVESNGPGNVVLIELAHEQVTEMTIGFGKTGTPAERVARDAWREAKAYLDRPTAAIGTHLADQWILPLAIAVSRLGGEFAFTTAPLTQHSLTHMALIQRFLPVRVEIAPIDGADTVRVQISR